MYPLQGEAKPDEPVALRPSSEDQEHAKQALIRVIRILLIAYLVMSMAYIWDEEEVRLHVWHTTIKVLQNTARLLGSWAIEVENKYNEHVKTLH